MADLKISALTASTTPLAGTEVLPIVQSSTTKQVSVANLTAGRAVSALSLATSAGYTFRAADNTNYELLRYVGGSNNPGIFVKVDETTNTANLWLSGSVTTAQVLGIGAAGVTDVLKIGSANVTVNAGNLVIGTSGNGIDFSATAGTGTSELLADYEEGTFTPVISGDSGAGTGTYTAQTGYYTKIGRQVTVEIVLSWTAHTGVGNILVAGLPFTCNIASQSAAPMLAYNLSLTALNYLVGRVRANSTLIDVLQSPTGGGAWNPVPIDTNVDAFVVTATYFV